MGNNRKLRGRKETENGRKCNNTKISYEIKKLSNQNSMWKYKGRGMCHLPL